MAEFSFNISDGVDAVKDILGSSLAKKTGYDIVGVYDEAFPTVAGKQLFRLEPVRDALSEGIDRLSGNRFSPSFEDETSGAFTSYLGTPIRDALSEGIDRLSGNRFSPSFEDETSGAFTSYLGTPIFFPIVFKGGLYDYYENGAIVQKELRDWILPATATAEFSRSKDITKSRPNGQQGTVKELWAFDDWSITIRGLIIGDNPNKFPADILRLLAQYEGCADSIEVVGDLFTWLGIDRIVIEKPRIMQIKGKPNVLAFQLDCVSDEDLEIILTE